MRHATRVLVALMCVCARAPLCVCPASESTTRPGLRRAAEPSVLLRAVAVVPYVPPSRRGRRRRRPERQAEHHLSRPRDVSANGHPKHMMHGTEPGARDPTPLNTGPNWPSHSLSLPSRLGYSPWSYSYTPTSTWDHRRGCPTCRPQRPELRVPPAAI